MEIPDCTTGAYPERLLRICNLAERGRFELPETFASAVFKTAAFNHSATSPSSDSGFETAACPLQMHPGYPPITSSRPGLDLPSLSFVITQGGDSR